MVWVMGVFQKLRLRRHLLLDLRKMDFLLENYLENHQNLLRENNILHYLIQLVLPLVVMVLVVRDQHLLLILRHHPRL